MAKMKASELVAKATNTAKNHKTVYMWGVFGAPVTEALIAQKAKQYPTWYTAARQAAFRALIGKGYFAFDCVCLIKGLLWGWIGDAKATYGGATYATNDVPDIGADTMIGKCLNVTNNFQNIIPGEAVWCTGHIGIYVGDGLAVECTPKWSNDVQITAVGNIGGKAGYKTRTWTKHGRLPYVDYDTVAPSPPKEATTPNTVTELKVGDVVNFIGGIHYVSASAATGKTCKPGLATVTQIYKGGAHPYHLVTVSGKGSTVYGWVNAADIETKNGAQAAKEVTEGATVTIKAGAVYGGLSSARGAAVPGSITGARRHTVRKIQTNNGVREALLLEINSWVAISYLTVV